MLTAFILTNKKNLKILGVLLIILMLSIEGCSNNRSIELGQKLKKDGFYIDGVILYQTKRIVGYDLRNFKNYYDANSKDADNKIDIRVHYFNNSDELESIVFIETTNDEGSNYCVYGGYDNCFDGKFSSTERKIEIAAQPKLKKLFNKFLKKYDMTKEEFIDLIEYIYDNEGKLE